MKKFFTVIILFELSLNITQASCQITGGACMINSFSESTSKNTQKYSNAKNNVLKNKKSMNFSCRLGNCQPRLLIKQIYTSKNSLH